jgi:TolA-binding protein
LNSSLKDDYTTLLPVFPYPNSESASSSSAEMERTIKKSSKTIFLHSITAKPEYKGGVKTPRQKRLYNKKEYNKWIDDAYLLMGKADLIKGDYMSATGAFRHIIAEYPKENTFIETQIWLARTLILKEEYLEAEEILAQLATIKKMHRRLISIYNATYADFCIHKKRYKDAIPKLETAADKARDKLSRLRYTFILGQLYQMTGQMPKATEKYLKVIRMNPPYEMTFNARVNLAGAYESGSAQAESIRKQLYKLLKDEKNKEYQDQIYYALGNIDMKEGNTDKAITNYKLSTLKSVSNQKQKARSYLAIADIKYNGKDYLTAQAYYDSAVNIIDESFPDFNKIESRAKSLQRLAKSLTAVIFEDSVQFVAKMSENERNMFIDKIIAQVKEKELEDQRKQQEAINEQQMNLSRIDEMNARGGGLTQTVDGSKWYFYNPSSKSYGENEFKLKWGKRKLEDNWRRSNKRVTGVAETTTESEEAEVKPDETAKKAMSNKSREFYTANLPVNDSLISLSHNKIRKGLYDAGMIYKDELSEYKLAMKEFEEIISRYPNDMMAANAAYQLYILNLQMQNTTKAEEYKSFLLSKFPESVYAKLLTNPEFLKELQEQEIAADKLYESSYNDYLSSNYVNSISKADKGINEYQHHKLAPKFLFIKALSKGKLLGLDTLRSGLNLLIKTYPKSEEASSGKEIIALMDIQNPEVKEKEDETIAKEIYVKASENEKHFFAIVIDQKKSNYNQLVFNLINLNLDNYTNSNLSVKAENLGLNKQIVVVREFKSRTEALNYFDAMSKNSNVYKDVGIGVLATFIINEANLATLKQDGAENRYVKFFNVNYNR